MPNLAVHRTENFAALRDIPVLRDTVRNVLNLRLAEELDRLGRVKWSETKDPLQETVTFTASLDLPDPPSALQSWQPARLTMDQIYAEIEGKNPYLRNPQLRPPFLASTDEVEKDIDYRPPAPAAPNTNKLEWAREARRQALSEVAAALDAVEADLLPDADPAFVIILLRDKLEGMLK